MGSDILKNGMLATAAWLDLEASIKSFEASTLRSDMETAQVLRQRAHDLLDTHLDFKAGNMIEITKLHGRK